MRQDTFALVAALFLLSALSGPEVTATESGKKTEPLPPAPPQINHFRAAFLPDGSEIIAMQSGTDAGVTTLVRMRPDGSNIREIEAGKLDVSGFDIAPDGRFIAVSGRDSDSPANVFVLDLVEETVTQVTRDGGGDPAWSPDGNRIAYAREGDIEGRTADLWVMDADGSDAVRLTSNPAVEYAPDWSPSGTQIVFMSEVDVLPSIHVIDADGTNEYAVTLNMFYDGYPKWSPDGQKIAYMSVLGGTETWNIVTVDADGSNRRSLASGYDWTWHPSWSPDGRSLLFDSRRDGRWGIYRMNADGSAQRKLTHRTSSAAIRIAREQGPGAFVAALAAARQADAGPRYYYGTEIRALAHEWIAAGRYEDAERLLEQALADEPESFNTYLVKSFLLRARNQPTPPQARELVDTFLVEGYAATLAAFRRAKAEFPGWIFLREWRFNRTGWRHFSAGMPGQGLDMLRLNVEFFPESARAHESLGDGFLELSRESAARRAYTEALRLDPSRTALREKLAALSSD